MGGEGTPGLEIKKPHLARRLQIDMLQQKDDAHDEWDGDDHVYRARGDQAHLGELPEEDWGVAVSGFSLAREEVCKSGLPETTKAPLMASWLSISVVSWLKLFKMMPVSVAEKKDCGALIVGWIVSMWTCGPVGRAAAAKTNLMTALRYTSCSPRAVLGEIFIRKVLDGHGAC